MVTGNMHQNLVKQIWFPRYASDRQTDRETYRLGDCNTLHSYRGRSHHIYYAHCKHYNP